MDRLLDIQEKGISVNPVIQTKGLGRRFGAVVALDNVDLEIPGGQIVGLVGPNGAGKTTLFSIVCGFLKPGSGTVNVLGQPPLSPELQGRVSILPQDAPLQRGVSIKSQFAFFARLQGFSSQEAEREAERVLGDVDLLDKSNDGPDTLSHGMRKRATLAQAFIGSPELILLDEPTAGLDPNQVLEVRKTIKGLGKTIFLSTHILQEVRKVADRILLIHQGRLVFSGTPEDLKEEPSLDDWFNRETKAA